jgi:hypothetical protein
MMSFIIGAGAAAIYEMQTAEEAHSREVGVHLPRSPPRQPQSIITRARFEFSLVGRTSLITHAREALRKFMFVDY